jgi:hypothetical protein
MDFSDLKTTYVRTVFPTDFLAGFLALVAVIAVAMPQGGFSFFAPWLIVGPVVFFATGFVRGRTAGNAWTKAVVVNVLLLLVLILTLRGTMILDTAGTILATFAVLVCCVAGGIWLRRRMSSVKTY